MKLENWLRARSSAAVNAIVAHFAVIAAVIVVDDSLAALGSLPAWAPESLAALTAASLLAIRNRPSGLLLPDQSSTAPVFKR